MEDGNLELALGLKFRDRQLLVHALVHRSYVNERGLSATDSFERMEYLGDAVLELAISEELYRRCPGMSEGELTKARAALVCGEGLARVARRLDLGEHILLGRGEETTGGRGRDSTLAAAFEAVVAAVYLDRNYREARRFILRVMADEINNLLTNGMQGDNPKSNLQEYLQGQGLPLPVYRLASSGGPEHMPVFTVEVLVHGEVMGVGEGGSKAAAERTAAQDALSRLTMDSHGSPMEEPAEDAKG